MGAPLTFPTPPDLRPPSAGSPGGGGGGPFQSVGFEFVTESGNLQGPPHTVVVADDGLTATLPAAGPTDVGRHWTISAGFDGLETFSVEFGDSDSIDVPGFHTVSLAGYEVAGSYGWVVVGLVRKNIEVLEP